MNSLEQRYIQGSFGRFSPSASIEIDAPVELVWGVLTDFESYDSWNQFTPSVICGGRLGDEVSMMVCFDGRKPLRQVEVLNVFEPPCRLAWGMILGSRRVLVANRYQALKAIGPSRTLYTTIDHVSGLLAPVVKLFYADAMKSGFQIAAEGLKSEAERFAEGATGVRS